MSNPTWDGIPVRQLPPHILGESKENYQPVALTLLRQSPPEVYRVDARDVLGIWIEGVLGDKNAPPPVRISELSNALPSFGYPLPVRDDGTLPVPLIDPINVKGMSLGEVQEALVKAYTVTKKILQPGRERIIVTLVARRQYHILVLREDSGSVTAGAQGGFGGGGFGSGGTSITETFRSTGTSIDLPAYENDVLNALSKTGGLPGQEAEDEVIVQRGGTPAITIGPGKSGTIPNDFGVLPKRSGDATASASTITSGQIIRIPLRVKPGEEVRIRPEDVILQNGDIVYVRVRKGEVFYTGGLLPARVFPLPKERDLDIVQAVLLVGGPFVNGGLSANNLSGTLVSGGIGSPSPSLITVLRRTEGGGQIPIRVNLNRAPA